MTIFKAKMYLVNKAVEDIILTIVLVSNLKIFHNEYNQTAHFIIFTDNI